MHNVDILAYFLVSAVQKEMGLINMNLLEKYQQKLNSGEITADPVQLKAVIQLNQLSVALENLPAPSAPATKKSGGFFSFFKNDEVAVFPPSLKGLYLWGGVGRGKTWLMDLFFESVETPYKKRFHFHHFMEMLHKAIKQHPDQEAPLQAIAETFAQDTHLLCLDELHLTEVANARLLLPVLDHLMRNNVVLVSTSNRHPDELYQGSLKRDMFVPYTDYMQQQMQVMHLDTELDYRTIQAERDYGENPQLDTLDEIQLAACFDELQQGDVAQDVVFTINHRQVPVRRACDNIIWLEFSVACEGTRTTSDYIWMTDRYEVVMLSNVHVLTEEDEPAARRFFNMVDELYDRKVRLYFSAETTLDQLYQGKRLTFAFKRTLSRLIAMHTANRLDG